MEQTHETNRERKKKAGTNMESNEFRQQRNNTHCLYDRSFDNSHFLADIREYQAPTRLICFPVEASYRSCIFHHAGTRPDEGVVPLVPIDTADR
jgi:hypothetical protein